MFQNEIFQREKSSWSNFFSQILWRIASRNYKKKQFGLKCQKTRTPDSIRWIFACHKAKNNFFSVLNLQGRQTSLPFLCRVGCFTANSLDDGKAICLGMLRPKIEQRSRSLVVSLSFDKCDQSDFLCTSSLYRRTFRIRFCPKVLGNR